MSVLRKVDVMCIIIKCDKTGTLDELNTYNSKIHFTHESTVTKTLQFFDCLIEIEQDNKPQTKTNRKKTLAQDTICIICLINQNM